MRQEQNDNSNQNDITNKNKTLNKILEHMVKSRLFRTDCTDCTDKAGNTAMHIVAKKGDSEAIIILATADDADVDRCNNLGQTPLYIAIASKKIEAVKALIDASADVNLEDSDGKRPLNYATDIAKNLEIECILREAGANFPSNRSPYTPLIIPN